jgi:hypothetical protein
MLGGVDAELAEEMLAPLDFGCSPMLTTSWIELLPSKRWLQRNHNISETMRLPGLTITQARIRAGE